MAEEFAAVMVLEIIKRLVAFGVEEISLVRDVKKEVEKLRSLLTKIQAVLNDAEKKHVDDEAVRLWLNDLKQVAYDAEDALDEIAYKGLKRRVEKPQNSSSIKNKVQNVFFSNNSLALHSKIAHKIKDINKKLDEIAKQQDRLKLRSSTVELHHPSTNSDRETSSFVDESAVVGRDEDKLKIVDMLIGCPSSQGSSSSSSANNNNISVIPIVGVGGLGKTTLAQLVYNDKYVVNHFDLRMWICVSGDFVVKTLLSQILKQTSNHEDGQKQTSLQVLRTEVQKELSAKKFLLVLDDVWDEDFDHWEILNLSLRDSAVGSKIIVTTRSRIVASIVGEIDAYFLQTLSEDDCWALFERRAFMKGGPERSSNLESMGKEIVKKCGGLPLAARTLGGLLHSKREEHEWLAVAKSEIWNMTDEQNKIMEVLKLSYKNLPPELKQCFSYCAIFPKDYEIENEVLIQLWMAQGFLVASGGFELMEDIGNAYFNILHSNSFFQEVKRDGEFGSRTVFKMHDLLHDLAQSISKFDCQAMEATETLEFELSGFRHLSLSASSEISTIPKALHQANKLRTFSLFRPSHIFYIDGLCKKTLDMLFKLRFFRVLDLSTMLIKELPSSIGKLKHLRYLNLSHTSLKVLPQSLTQLYNLQTLKLEQCYILQKLPKNLGNLINLRHFCIDSVGKWDEMPSKMGQLHFLQTCPVFKVGIEENGCSNIAELGSLSLLRGDLKIEKLENVEDATLASRANLYQKKRINTLTLKWSTDIKENIINHDYHHHVAAVLEVLQPHSNLKELRIEGFQGVKFPRWVTSGSALSNLVELFLEECSQCEHIRSFGKLPCLKRLWICSMRNMKYLGGSWDGNANCNAYLDIVDKAKEEKEVVEAAYPNLQELTLKHLPNLEEWFENVFPQFACLEKLTIISCPKLRKMPNAFPSLKQLAFYGVVGGMEVTSITNNNYLTSLTSLTICYSEDLTFLSQGVLQNNNHCEL